MGCNWALAREVARDPQRESEWVAVGVVVGMASAPLYLLAGYFLLPLLLPSDRIYLLPIARLCLLLIPLDILNQILLSVEHGLMRWRRYNWLRLSFFLFYLGFISLISWSRRIEVGWFVIALLASHFLTVLLRFWIQRKRLASGRVRLDGVRSLLRAGMPYFGATVSNLASLQFDTILVVSLLNTEAAGIYAVASALANGQSSVSDALGITSFALVSNEANAGSREKIITETFRQSALASCGTGLALSCVIPFCVVPLFGRGFAPAIWPAVVLAMAASVVSIREYSQSRAARRGAPASGRDQPTDGNCRRGARRPVISAAVRAHGDGARRIAGCVHASDRAGDGRREMAQHFTLSILAVSSGKSQGVLPAIGRFAVA